MRFYDRDESDPQWLVKAAQFHGHLGPWVAVGALLGKDACDRLQTRGHWFIEVICWMPKEKQRQPFSCILDGLQASTGATLGKRNIRMDFSREIVTDDQPVVDVIRRTDDDQEAAGLRYTLNTALIEIMSGITPDRLEQIGRDIASRDVETLFDVQPLSHAQMSG